MEGWQKPFYWSSTGLNSSNHAVVGVSWYEAEAYCRWLTWVLEADTGELIRLPTEAEWEYSAGGVTGRHYPWGDEPPSSELANYDDTGLDRTSAVAVFLKGQTPEGVYDMAGNCWEWCRDWSGKYSIRETIDSKGSKDGAHRVIRGGSCINDASCLRSAFRALCAPTSRNQYHGFRCAREERIT